jgi:hypothetical protein
MVSHRSMDNSNQHNSRNHHLTVNLLNRMGNHRHTASRPSNTGSNRTRDTRPHQCLRQWSKPMLTSAA